MKNIENKKGLPFGITICAIIIAIALFKQFDFETLKFEKPALAIVYILTLAMSIYFILNSLKNKQK